MGVPWWRWPAVEFTCWLVGFIIAGFALGLIAVLRT